MEEYDFEIWTLNLIGRVRKDILDLRRPDFTGSKDDLFQNILDDLFQNILDDLFQNILDDLNNSEKHIIGLDNF